MAARKTAAKPAAKAKPVKKKAAIAPRRASRKAPKPQPSQDEYVTILVPSELSERLANLAVSRGVDMPTLIRVALHNLAQRSGLRDLTSKLGFGKYANEQIETVIRCDPRYITWCLKTIDSFNLSSEALDLLYEIEGSDGNDLG